MEALPGVGAPGRMTATIGFRPMQMRYLNAIIFLVPVLALVVCGRIEARSSTSVYQMVEIGNLGHGPVTGVKVNYGETVIPAGDNLKVMFAHQPMVVAETRMMHVPESATVHWITEDGIPHNVPIKLSALHVDQSLFVGFRFVIVDSNVDVFSISKTQYWPKDVDLVRAKIFSAGG